MPPTDLKTFDCVKPKIDSAHFVARLLQYKRNHLTGWIDSCVCTRALKITRFKQQQQQKTIAEHQNVIYMIVNWIRKIEWSTPSKCTALCTTLSWEFGWVVVFCCFFLFCSFVWQGLKCISIWLSQWLEKCLRIHLANAMLSIL